MQIAEGEIFKFPLELTDAEPVGQRGVDVGDLLGHQHPGLFIGLLRLPQAGDPLRQLDHHGAHILDHGEQHAPHVVDLLRRGFAAVEGLQGADSLHLQHPFHQLGDLGTEVLVHPLLADETGFDEGVDDGGLEGAEIHAEHQQDAHHLDPAHQQPVGERFVTERQTVLVDGSQLILVTVTQGERADPLLQGEVVFQMNIANRNHGINPLNYWAEGCRPLPLMRLPQMGIYGEFFKAYCQEKQ